MWLSLMVCLFVCLFAIVYVQLFENSFISFRQLLVDTIKFSLIIAFVLNIWHLNILLIELCVCVNMCFVRMGEMMNDGVSVWDRE